MMLHSALEFLSSSAHAALPDLRHELFACNRAGAKYQVRSDATARTGPERDASWRSAPICQSKGRSALPCGLTLTATRSPQSLSALGSIEQLSIANRRPWTGATSGIVNQADLNSEAKPGASGPQDLRDLDRNTRPQFPAAPCQSVREAP